MKSLQDFKQIVEEEKQDFTKFDALVRAGLGNKAQIQRLHQILGKMAEDKPNFSTADRAIIQNIFNKLIDLVTTNKQINTIARKAIREESGENHDYAHVKKTMKKVDFDRYTNHMNKNDADHSMENKHKVDTQHSGSYTGKIHGAEVSHKVSTSGEKEYYIKEGVVDTSDFKLGKDGRKVKAHRVTLGDKGITEPVMPVAESVEINESSPKDPPFVLVLKRKAIRLYPDGTRIALYHNDRLDKSFSIPYGPGVDAVVQAEETQIEEAVNPVQHLQKIKDNHQIGTVNHKDGSASKIDVQTAHALLMVHNSLNGDNKKKFSDMMARSNGHMKKAADFAWKHVK
jgi:hypothetical protein